MGTRQDYEIYYVSNPTSAIGVHGHLRWAVSLNGDWKESFGTRQVALEYVSSCLGVVVGRVKLKRLEGGPASRYAVQLVGVSDV